jgi:Competence protein CoiA-like family
MNIARAMALGGQIVYADNCDFSSSDKLKLLCYVCREPVYLRKGDIRKPYFAHHHATSSRQVEECKLRVSAYGNSTETSNVIEDRGQRLEIFQQHFLSLIYVGQEKIVDDVKFNNWIHSIKRDNTALPSVMRYTRLKYKYF